MKRMKKPVIASVVAARTGLKVAQIVHSIKGGKIPGGQIPGLEGFLRIGNIQKMKMALPLYSMATTKE
jgi:hypothetical protein